MAITVMSNHHNHNSKNHTNVVLVAMSQDQARLWLHGLEPDAKPVYVHARAEGIEHRVHTAQYHSGKDQEHVRPEYYERIVNLIRDADGVLLVGHGNGKARATDNFDQYLTRKHYELSNKIWGSFTMEIESKSDRAILAAARDWIAVNRPFVSI
jgi:hypothetical protein